MRVPRWVRRAPVIATPLRRFAKRHAPTGPLNLTIEGLTWQLAPRDNKVDFDIWYKRRLDEPHERAFLAEHLEAGDVFVDIGANIGLYTVALLAAVPGLTAVTFEPLERLRARQLANLHENGMSGRAKVHAEAVGPDGEMTLFESQNAGRSSLIAFDTASGGQRVIVRPLAELLTVAPAAIKIDVEGFEAEALMPYFDATGPDRWPRAVVIETLHRAIWSRDCLSELFQRGYVLAGETDENALLVRA